jgi:hypothetical protein
VCNDDFRDYFASNINDFRFQETRFPISEGWLSRPKARRAFATEPLIEGGVDPDGFDRLGASSYIWSNADTWPPGEAILARAQAKPVEIRIKGPPARPIATDGGRSSVILQLCLAPARTRFATRFATQFDFNANPVVCQYTE